MFIVAAAGELAASTTAGVALLSLFGLKPPASTFAGYVLLAAWVIALASLGWVEVRARRWRRSRNGNR